MVLCVLSLDERLIMDGSLGQGVLGSGLAQNAAILEKYRPAYMKMAEQMQVTGETPPPFEEWAAAQHANSPQDRRGLLQSLFNRVSG